MGMLTHETGWRTNFIAEEGWHLLGGPGGRVVRSKSKLSRGLGLAIISALHHISDIPAGSEAIAMIKEAQTIHLFRQEHDDDIADCVRYFNLEHSNAAALGALPQGDHLLKVGTHKEIRVHHRRTPGKPGSPPPTPRCSPHPPPRTRTTTRSKGRRAAEGRRRCSGLTSGCRGLTSGWAGPTNGPGCSPPGNSPRWPRSPAPSACSCCGTSPWSSPPGSVPATSASRSRGLLTAAPLDLPARYHPAGPVPTLVVFGVLCAFAVAGCVWWAVRGPHRRGDRRRGRRGQGPVGLADRKQARRSAGEIRARDKAAFTRRASVDAGVLDVDTAPLAEVGLLLGHTSDHREPVVLSLEDQVGVIAATGAGKTLFLMIGAALDAPGPLITTSTKPEILDAIVESRTRRGRVWVSTRWTSRAGPNR